MTPPLGRCCTPWTWSCAVCLGVSSHRMDTIPTLLMKRCLLKPCLGTWATHLRILFQTPYPSSPLGSAFMKPYTSAVVATARTPHRIQSTPMAVLDCVSWHHARNGPLTVSRWTRTAASKPSFRAPRVATCQSPWTRVSCFVPPAPTIIPVAARYYATHSSRTSTWAMCNRWKPLPLSVSLTDYLLAVCPASTWGQTPHQRRPLSRTAWSKYCGTPSWTLRGTCYSPQTFTVMLRASLRSTA